MLKLAHNITHHGFTVTLVNLDFIHRKIMPEQQMQSHGGIRMISFPDGLSPDFEGSDLIKITESLEKEFGIKTAALWTASMENLALILRVPELIESGIIDENGFEQANSPVQLDDGVLNWEIKDLPWSSPGFPEEVLKTVFQCCANVAASLPSFDFLLVNSFEELEPSACRLIPNIYPIGPLFTKEDNLPGSFWSQDRTCLAWLDKHPLNSVIYVAFGSIVFFNQKQFEELATGLEMTGRPFFWVVRTNFVEGSVEGSGLEFPDGFLERVSDLGKIVEWANQEEVLSHRSVGCFVSHCGWNSVLDGLWCGVPFLCWPYYVDQFHNKESVCEGWKVGLKLDAEGEIGLVTSSEIASKVEQLLNDDTIKGNVIRLRKIAIESVNEGGFSHHNFTSFIDNLCS
ncbi:UDP-glycosyltransferase 83A1 [Linum perenne]